MVAAAADHHWQAFQLGIAQQFDRCIERIHVEMRDTPLEYAHGPVTMPETADRLRSLGDLVDRRCRADLQHGAQGGNFAGGNPGADTGLEAIYRRAHVHRRGDLGIARLAGDGGDAGGRESA